MKKMILPVFSMITIVFLACNGDKINDYTYYDVFRMNESLPVGSYRFSTGGNCVYYIYDNSSGTRRIWDVDDVIEQNSWGYDGAGIIDLCGYKYNFVGLHKDTIVIKYINGDELERIVKSKNQNDRKKKAIG